MKTKIIAFSFFISIFLSAGADSIAGMRTGLVYRSYPTNPTGDFAFFRARRTGNNNVMLNWVVVNPLMVQTFVVERSTDGLNFEPVAELSSSGMANYSYRDRSVYRGRFWYRITVYNYDGTFSVSEVEKIRISSGCN